MMRSATVSGSTSVLPAALRAALPCRATTRSMSRIDSSANSSACWKVRPKPAEMRFHGASPRRSASPILRAPAAFGLTKPLSTLSSVVLPEPLGPIRPMALPAGTEIDTFCSALTPPKDTETFSTTSSLPAVGRTSATSAARSPPAPALSLGLFMRAPRLPPAASSSRLGTTPLRRNRSTTIIAPP